MARRFVFLGESNIKPLPYWGNIGFGSMSCLMHWMSLWESRYVQSEECPSDHWKPLPVPYYQLILGINESDSLILNDFV